ncbi:MAG: hypothetical protein WC861_07145 [Candidatus Micrarchaeia archaeon]|jgi:hypothetical protein
MALVSLRNAKALNNDFLKSGRTCVSSRPLNSSVKKTSAYQELEKMAKQYPLPHSADNPNVALLIECNYASKCAIETILSVDSIRKFTKRDLYASSIVCLLRLKPTPLMVLRGKLNAAVEKAWAVELERMLQIKESMQKEYNFTVAYVRALSPDATPLTFTSLFHKFFKIPY